MIIIVTVILYFSVLLLLGKIAGRGGDNGAFFSGGKRSPWYVVAIGMVGASISGITFVSVPGMVVSHDMTYLQACMGFIVGYFVVALVLLPIYYKKNLVSIYGWFGDRMGERSYKTASGIFLMSKMCGASLRFYVVCLVLYQFVLRELGVPFWCTAIVMVLLIWLYTKRGGIKTLVWTDLFQTVCMLGALLLIIMYAIEALGMNASEALVAIRENPHSRIFVFDDWMSSQNFWKQFVSGIFIVIVMTGLDQDMMQKNLTCKSLRDAQKDMCSYGFAFVPVNLLFLSLGVLLLLLAEKHGMMIPAESDSLLPMFAASGEMGTAVVVLFTIGVIAASFSSADSAITSMTTVLCVDICKKGESESFRRKAHLMICILFTLFILLFEALNSTSVIDAVYILCSYTYGPLLGMSAFCLLTKRRARDRFVPYIAIISPVLCFAIDRMMLQFAGYEFGYELLVLNGSIVFLLLMMVSRKAVIIK